ncbi:hypothetical protein [Polaromonas sp.]|uniref:hypothetical protein n=1 Tax=Polaromonas sp. TaxID=1869339 RepID=UPI003561C90E
MPDFRLTGTRPAAVPSPILPVLRVDLSLFDEPHNIVDNALSLLEVENFLKAN